MSRDDPMDRARAALEAARAARGVDEGDEDEPLIVDPRNPLAAAEAALARAQDAREAAARTRRLAAEADARRQLQRLKAQSGSVRDTVSSGDPDAALEDDDTEEIPVPRPRRL